MSAASGLVEVAFGFLGAAAAVTASVQRLRRGLTFAAGAMLCIIIPEIVPETTATAHRNRPPQRPPGPGSASSE